MIKKMKDKLLKVISTITIMVMVLNPISVFAGTYTPGNEKVKSVKITSSYKSKDGGTYAGNGNSEFIATGGGKKFTGLCANSPLTPVGTGMTLKTTKLNNSSTLAKIAYWGYKHPNNSYWAHHAASIVHHGSTTNSHPKARGTVNEAKKLKVPNEFEAYIGTHGKSYQDVLLYRMGITPGYGKLIKGSTNKNSLKLSNYSFKGIEYTIYLKNKKTKVGKFTLNAKGVSDTFKANPGIYYVKESKTGKSNYKVDSKFHKLVIKKNKTTTLNVLDAPDTGDFKLKKELKEGSDGDLAGFEFKLTNLKNGKVTYTGKTDKNGNIDIKGILLGKYKVTEKYRAGYISETKPQIVSIEKNKATSIKWVNKKEKEQLKLKIVKTTNDDGVVEGFTFKVEGKLKNSKELTEKTLLDKVKPSAELKENADKFTLGTWKADSNDLAKINSDAKEHKTGAYSVTFTNTFKSKDGDTSKDIPVSFKATVNLIESTKTAGSGTSKAADLGGKGEVKYSDIEFAGAATIFTATKTTNSTGTINFRDDDILPGIYTVTEVMTDKQKARYHQPESQTKEIDKDSADFVFHFENKAKRTPIKLVKYSPDGNIANIKFRITGTTAFGEAVNIETETNALGEIEDMLYAGDYVIEEIGFDSKNYINTYKLDGYKNPAIKFSISGEEKDTVYLGGKNGTGGEGTVFKNMPIPEIKTTAVHSDTDDHFGVAKKSMTIVDKVSYKKLIPGEEYELKGVLMDKATKKPMLDDHGKKIISKVKFIPKETNGEAEVTFTFDGVNLEGKSTVAFEYLYHEGKEVAVHTDITDDGQTVDFPKLKTKFLNPSTGSKVITAKAHNIVEDTVTYKNLKPGETYEATATVYDKKTGKVIEGVSGTTTFKASKNGEFKVVLSFNGIKYAGRKLVCFESVRLKGNIAAVHNDINSKSQTITIQDIGKIEIKDNNRYGGNVNTGDNNHVLFMCIVFLLSIGVLTYVVIHNRREDGDTKADGGNNI